MKQINKKEFNDINKNIKKIMKDQLQVSVEKNVVKKVNSVFFNGIDESIRKKISDEIIKFIKGSYQRQLLENVDFKTLVKDTTLANSVKEHGERHLFTLANSRIFKQEEK